MSHSVIRQEIQLGEQILKGIIKKRFLYPVHG